MRKVPLIPANESMGWLAWFLLGYYVLFAGWTLASDVSALVKWLMLPLTVIFLFLYFRTYWVSGTAAIANVLLITALSMSIASWNPPMALTIIIYSSTCAGGALPTRRAVEVISINAVSILLVSYLYHLPYWFLLQGLIFSIVGGGTVLTFSIHGRQRDLIIRKQEDIEHLTKIAERERISRDLHDVLGHALSLITLKSELAQKLIDRDADQAKKELADIEHASRNALSQIRETIIGYRSAGLTHEIEQVKKMLDAARVQTDIQCDVIDLPPAHENVIGLALREAVTNVVRHAHATTCRFTLTSDMQNVRLVVEDNGDGTVVTFGHGLLGMKERVQTLNGFVQVAHANPGIRIVVEIPF